LTNPKKTRPPSFCLVLCNEKSREKGGGGGGGVHEK